MNYDLNIWNIMHIFDSSLRYVEDEKWCVKIHKWIMLKSSILLATNESNQKTLEIKWII